MKIPQIQMTHRRAQMYIDQQPAKHLKERMPAGPELSIKQPELDIEHQRAELHIDHSLAGEAYARMSALKLNQRIYAQVMPHIVHEIIASIAREGNALADVHKSNNVIAELAKEPPREMKEYKNLAEVHPRPLKIDYTPGELHVHLERGEVTVDYEFQPARFKYIPYELDIGLSQFPALEIEWLGKHVDYVL